MGVGSSTPQGAPLQAVQAYVPQSMSSTSSILLGLFVGFLVILVVVAAYRSLNSSTQATLDVAPVPISGKTGGTIPASSIPLSPGSDYNMQFWMFVQDWDYRFGQEKEVLMRTDPINPGTVNPRITLHPTDNTLNVYLTTFTSGSTSLSSQPAAPGATSHGSTWLCAVENIPLQTWFSVSITQFQRNLDVFINGNLVKSTVIPAVPRTATGNILVGANGGFSGYVCSVHGAGKQLLPADARSFYAAGTSCSSLVNGGGAAGPTGTTYNLFGYTIIIEDSTGKQVTSTAALSPVGSDTTSWNPFASASSNAPVTASCPAGTFSTTGKDTDGHGAGCTACASGKTSSAGATGCTGAASPSS